MREGQRALHRRAGGWIWPLWLVASLIGVASLPAARTTPAARPAVAAPRPLLEESDRQFLLQAAGSSLYQLQAARLAEEFATTPQVRAYGAMLAEQHRVLSAELGTLARARSLPLPPALPRDGRDRVAALASFAPETFDRDYVQQVGIADQENAVVLFDTASRTLADSELRAWALKTLPLLQDQLVAAQEMPLPVRVVALRT